jgi:tripartite-type tricarboxylate transporter receptor subunit TctC
MSAVQSGTLMPLATLSERRLPNLLDVPAAAETYPGLVATAWLLLVAPGKTPEPVIRKINQHINAVLALPELKQRLQDLGAFTRTMSPAEATNFTRTEQAAWRPIVRAINLKSQ